ncbi:MAG TPA: hypothetical protein VNS55_00025 [Nocardioides sp.]|nr:hypothetical protein [Nocardioides sp.]
MGRRTRATATRARANGGKLSAVDAAAWVEAGREITPLTALERLTSYQQFVLGNVTVIGTLLVVAGGIGATVATSRESLYAGDFPLVPVAALVTAVVAGIAVLVALLSRRVRVQLYDVSGPRSVRDYYSNELVVRSRRLRVATTLFFAAVVLAVATAVTAGALAIADHADQPAPDPHNEAALSATFGGDGAVTVYLKGAVGDLADDEYLVVEVTSAGQTIISGNVYPDADGNADLASEARVPSGSTEADATITVMRDGEVVGSPYLLSTTFTAGGS